MIPFSGDNLIYCFGGMRLSKLIDVQSAISMKLHFLRRVRDAESGHAPRWNPRRTDQSHAKLRRGDIDASPGSAVAQTPNIERASEGPAG